MNQHVLTIEVSKWIKCPIETVKKQFADIGHHMRYRVHPRVEYTILSENQKECRIRQTVRVLGLRQVDESVLRWVSKNVLMNDVIAGDNEGLRLMNVFEMVRPDTTLVNLTLEVPLRGFKKLLKPFFRIAVYRTVAKALEEDRIDLEQYGYPR